MYYLLYVYAILSKTCLYIYDLNTGRWDRDVPRGNNPEGKTLGILGMGGIGKALAKRMRGFDVEIQYYNRNRHNTEGNNY